MLATFEYIHLFYLAVAIVLDVAANVFMKLSNGFERKMFAVFAILFVLVGYSSLSLAVVGIQLSVAYGIWGGIGLISTALLGATMFREKIKPAGFAGIILLMIGVVLIRYS